MYRVLVVLGSGGQLAQAVLKELPDTYSKVICLSTKSLVLNVGNRQLATTPIDYPTFSALRGGVSAARLEQQGPIRFDIVVFSGITDQSIFMRSTVSEIDTILDINLRTPILFTKTLLEAATPRNCSFVFVSSSRAELGGRGILMYSTTKHAISGFSRSLAMEYGPLGLRSNVLSLGITRYGMATRLPDVVRTTLLQRSANRRITEATSIADCLTLLWNTRDINGATLNCDGGYD